jgi:hypothetical protein
MKGPLLASDGARFEARIQATREGPQASFQVLCDVGNSTLSETDIQLCKDEEEARRWLHAAAVQRGFTTYPIERR